MTPKITKQQIIQIKTLQRTLRMSNDQYREFLWQWNVKSCKDLSAASAMNVIAVMRKTAGQPVRPHGWGRQKYNDLGRERGSYLATAKQLRMVESMWQDVCRRKTEIGREMTLQAFVKRMTGMDDLLLIKKEDVKILVKAMEEMRGKKNAAS